MRARRAERSDEASDAAQRTERPSDPDRSRNADGRALSPLLAAGAALRGTAGERMPAGAGEDPVRAPARFPRQPGPARPDRRVLRPPRRVAVVRPQRGVGPALPLSRLEIR